MRTLEKGHTFEEDTKKSRFIATAVRVDTPEQAMEQIKALADADASHNCWAYKINDQYRFSDDGEPGGTAGRPILTAIERQGMDHVVVVVTRFFGGIKLGAGGLTRAYGGTASKCLRNAQSKEVKPEVRIRVRVPFESIGSLYPLLDKFKAEKLSDTYLEDGADLVLKMELDSAEAFGAALGNATKGAAVVEVEPLAADASGTGL
jgi:uncharacterized YigZ family protein